MLHTLNNFLIGHILGFLTIPEICKSRQTCKHIKQSKPIIQYFTFNTTKQINFFSTLRTEAIKKLKFDNHNCCFPYGKAPNINMILKTFKFKNLTTLHVTYYNINDDTLTNDICQSLQKLTIHFSPIDNCIKHIASITTLTSLNIQHTEITKATAQLISSMINLTSLNLRNTYITDEIVQTLQSLTSHRNNKSDRTINFIHD